MRDAIANLQFVYKLQKRLFAYLPENPSNDFRHTFGQDPQRQPSFVTDAPRYHTMVDTPASGQGNSSALCYFRGGSKYAPRESVEHRESLQAALVEMKDHVRLSRRACRRFATDMNASRLS